MLEREWSKHKFHNKLQCQNEKKQVLTLLASCSTSSFFSTHLFVQQVAGIQTENYIYIYIYIHILNDGDIQVGWTLPQLFFLYIMHKFGGEFGKQCGNTNDHIISHISSKNLLGWHMAQPRLVNTSYCCKLEN